MTPADRAASSRQAQELPEQITDPSIIARVASLVRGATASGSGVAA